MELNLASAVKSTIQFSKSFSTRKHSIEPAYTNVIPLDMIFHEKSASLSSFSNELLIDPPVPEIFLPSMTSVQRQIKKKKEFECQWEDAEIEIPFIPMFNRTIYWEDEVSIYS